MKKQPNAGDRVRIIGSIGIKSADIKYFGTSAIVLSNPFRSKGFCDVLTYDKQHRFLMNINDLSYDTDPNDILKEML